MRIQKVLFGYQLRIRQGQQAVLSIEPVLQARGHEMELLSREKALAEALAVPVSTSLSPSPHI